MTAVGHEEKYALLSRRSLFGALPPAEIAAVLQLLRERQFTDGQVIFQKGEPGPSMMAVLRGRVRISACSATGREIILSMVEPGEIFGEMALLDGHERSADATAVGECTVLVIDRATFVAFLKRNPQIAIRLLSLLCQRLRDTDEMVEDIALLDLPQRLARLLLKLTRSYGRPTHEGLSIGLKLTQSDLGSLVAASRESINKQLRAWQDDGLITVSRGYITLLRPHEFEALGSD